MVRSLVTGRVIVGSSLVFVVGESKGEDAISNLAGKRGEER